MMPKTGRTTFIRASMGRIFRENLWLTVHCELGKRDLIVRGLTSGDVRFGSKADSCSAATHVRFTPNSDRESGHRQPSCPLHPRKRTCAMQLGSPLWANSGHRAVLFDHLIRAALSKSGGIVSPSDFAVLRLMTLMLSVKRTLFVWKGRVDGTLPKPH